MKAHTASKSNKYQPGTAVSASTRRMVECEQVSGQKPFEIIMPLAAHLFQLFYFLDRSLKPLFIVWRLAARSVNTRFRKVRHNFGGAISFQLRQLHLVAPARSTASAPRSSSLFKKANCMSSTYTSLTSLYSTSMSSYSTTWKWSWCVGQVAKS